MRGIDAKWEPLIYGVIQSWLTTGVASAISALRLTAQPGEFLQSWIAAWLLAWLAMLPVVALASPVIRRAAAILVSPRG